MQKNLATLDGEGKVITWQNLGFDRFVAGFMLVMEGNGTYQSVIWGEPQIVPYGEVQVNPLASGLNYGVSLFDGLVAFRWADGSIRVCNPWPNAARFRRGAARVRLPQIPADRYVELLLAVVKANADFVPENGQGRLYLRPVLFAAGRSVGYSNCRRYIFAIACEPVGDYIAKPPVVLVHPEYQRLPLVNEVWDTKTGANYTRILTLKDAAVERGFGDILFADGREGASEFTTANLLAEVVGTTGERYLIRPDPAHRTVLDGITSQTLVRLAETEGIRVETRYVPLSEVLDRDRTVAVAMVGTAAVSTRVHQLHVEGEALPRPVLEDGQLISRLKSLYAGIQQGVLPDRLGLMVPVL